MDISSGSPPFAKKKILMTEIDNDLEISTSDPHGQSHTTSTAPQMEHSFSFLKFYIQVTSP